MTMGSPKSLLLSVVFLALTFTTTGCVSDWTRRSRVETTPAPPPAAPSQAIDPGRVEQRIQDLEALVDDPGDLDEGQQSEARALLKDYRKVLDDLGSPGKEARTAAILFDRLGALEERLFRSGRTEPVPVKTAVPLLSRKSGRIRDAYLAGDYNTVIQYCSDLESTYGPDALTPDIKILFALALGEEGKTEDAIRMGERVLPEIRGRPGLIQLRSRMVDWQQQEGNSKKARAHYEKLVDEMMEQRVFCDRAERLLRDSSPSPRREERPSDILSSPPAEAAVSGPLDDLLHRVDVLIQEKDYHKARLLLIRQRIRYSEGPEIVAIDQAMERVDRAEAKARERSGMSGERFGTDADEVLGEARRLLEAEDFEGALNELDQLEAQRSEPPPDAEELRDQAVSRLIQRERDKAAKQFLLARNAPPEERAAHLRTSHQTLSDLLNRFPEASLAPKIRSNLATVKKEMERIGVSP